MKTVFIGASAWGTAMAASVASQQDAPEVVLWACDAEQAQAIQSHRVNTRCLPDMQFPDALQVIHGDVIPTVANADLLILDTPMAALRQWLTQLRDCQAPVVWLCKGFEATATTTDTGLMGYEICQQVAPRLRAGVMSGPSFAAEVACGQPTALVAASQHREVGELLVETFHSPAMRIYISDDITGVEVGAATKNVIAIATGLCDGLELGLNTRAALITRGLAEMTRLGVALGARQETFMGLSGLGDLVLTATGNLSRNRKVGMQLAQGKTQEQAVAALGYVAEGVYSARTVLQRAHKLGVEMPITETVVHLLDGTLSVRNAVNRLMARNPRRAEF
ncbi:MAG: NAD(P)H-dependent glycerol-3-phosphate dehydrogenase [Acidovorax sp.]|uniref:NAD(P)H-dependent glycerol-3-phosphate dehydrogenase n=1 Tax=Acidovorax sp. TaxID=1872122 RepID=UPI0039E4D567